MPVTNSNISDVIKALRKGIAEFTVPSVTLVGRKWKSPFCVLISCLLSLRTKDETTLGASQRLFALAETPAGMRQITRQKIQKTIYPVGFYKTKASRIKGICDDLGDKFDDQVPDEIDVLLTLKGVGRKTANLVLTEGFGKHAMCVDTHVHRISNRMGYIKTKTPEKTEWALRDKLPKKFWIDYNALLVTWGQNICKPISPLCTQCGIRKYCQRVNVNVSR